MSGWWWWGRSVSGSEDGGKAGAVGLTGASISRAWCETEPRRFFRLRAFHWLAAAGRRAGRAFRAPAARGSALAAWTRVQVRSSRPLPNSCGAMSWRRAWTSLPATTPPCLQTPPARRCEHEQRLHLAAWLLTDRVCSSSSVRMHTCRVSSGSSGLRPTWITRRSLSCTSSVSLHDNHLTFSLRIASQNNDASLLS